MADLQRLASRHASALLCLAVLLASLAGCLTTAFGPEESPDGPLDVPPRHVSYFYPEEIGGGVLTDGLQVLRLTDDKPVVIDSVEQLGVTGDIEVLGLLHAGRQRKIGSIQLSPGFPPQNREFGPLGPLEGVRVPPGRLGVELLIGYRVDEDEFAARTGLRIRYHRGEARYVADFPAGIAFCPGLFGDACEAAYADWEREHPVVED